MRCVVTGSYRKFLGRIMDDVVPVFEKAGIEVVYPKKSNIINPDAPFPLMKYDMITLEQAQKKIHDHILSYPNGYGQNIITPLVGYLAQERQEHGLPLNEDLIRSIAVELDFLNAALRSDFTYVFNPGGYTGMSTTVELMNLIASKIPVYALNRTAPRRERHMNAAVRMQQGKGRDIKVGDFVQWDVTREVMWYRWMDKQIEATGGFFSPEQLVEHLYST